jgi:hypothetical protein
MSQNSWKSKRKRRRTEKRSCVLIKLLSQFCVICSFFSINLVLQCHIKCRSSSIYKIWIIHCYRKGNIFLVTVGRSIYKKIWKIVFFRICLRPSKGEWGQCQHRDLLRFPPPLSTLKTTREESKMSNFHTTLFQNSFVLVS